jgi:hypothetical protein
VDDNPKWLAGVTFTDSRSELDQPVVNEEGPVVVRNDMAIIALMNGSVLEVRCESRRMRKYRPVPNN